MTLDINRCLYTCLFLACMLIHGCASKTWMRLDQTHMNGPCNTFSVDLPLGWIHAAFYDKQIYITKDGPNLQTIRIMKTDHDKAFANIEKTSTHDMLPSELSELAIASIKTYVSMTNVEVVKNEPANICGVSGFRLHIQYKDPKGLRYENVIYGFADEAGYYTLSYHAPSLYYFALDLDTFEDVVSSFWLNGNGQEIRKD